MSNLMEVDIKRWTAKRKTALVLDIVQGKTTVSEASQAFDISPSEIEQGVDEGRKDMENALRTKPLEVKEQYDEQLRELQDVYGEAMLELRARRKLASLLGNENEICSSSFSRDCAKKGATSAGSSCAGGSSCHVGRCTTAA